jgi:hypothetical protein
VERRSIRLGRGTLGTAAPAARRLGPRALGKSTTRMVFRGRSLALELQIDLLFKVLRPFPGRATLVRVFWMAAAGEVRPDHAYIAFDANANRDATAAIT